MVFDYKYGVAGFCDQRQRVAVALSMEGLERLNHKLSAEEGEVESGWMCRGVTVFCEPMNEGEEERRTFASVVLRGPEINPAEPPHLTPILQRALAHAFHEAGLPVSFQMEQEWEMLEMACVEHELALTPTPLPPV